ncbi:hypothetical protein COCON_G00198570 [Conger conger]|uniref:Uncharacterized protein n=1 Tax=Conger conger TaxID=82655 RepID=A0A9Q1HQL0_CONCO|nr:hypothetical protein COCON_G00198570 [Conger conger]
MFAVVVVALAAGPLHAQCSVKWIINLPCDAVSSILADQIKNWTTEDCPGNSQKCLYALVSVRDNIFATHTTPVLRFVDDIEFVFRPAESDGCEFSGHSVSRSWYAVLDSGTNYRNMYNLMQGGGLSSTPGFSEFTSDRNCTQYSTAKQLMGL